MHLFYCPEISDSLMVLPAEESHHIFHVLRLTTGTDIQITDGCGSLITARITEVSKKNVVAQKLADIPVPPPLKSLHIAIAPTKNIDRFEWFLEKATEIGVATVTPLLCQRSERKEVKPERLEKLIIAAAKQSRHFHFPLLKPMIPFSLYIESTKAKARFIAHCIDEPTIAFRSIVNNFDDTVILIGPEGDFSPHELELAKMWKFQGVSLGESRLRTETAAIVACALFSV